MKKVWLFIFWLLGIQNASCMLSETEFCWINDNANRLTLGQFARLTGYVAYLENEIMAVLRDCPNQTLSENREAWNAWDRRLDVVKNRHNLALHALNRTNEYARLYVDRKRNPSEGRRGQCGGVELQEFNPIPYIIAACLSGVVSAGVVVSLLKNKKNIPTAQDFFKNKEVLAGFISGCAAGGASCVLQKANNYDVDPIGYGAAVVIGSGVGAVLVSKVIQR